jgi:RNase P subunit RPR2
MRILQNNDYIQVRCPKCNSLLGVNAGDLSPGGHTGQEIMCTCAACRWHIQIPFASIPKRWVTQLDWLE